jgi:hypothetical protein
MMVVLGVFLFVLSATVQAVGKTVPAGPGDSDSPLYKARLDATLSEWKSESSTDGSAHATNEGAGDQVISFFFPPPSYCVVSACFGSLCVGSLCASSTCLGSGCVGSVCLGTGCLGTTLCLKNCATEGPPRPIELDPEGEGPSLGSANNCNQL